MKQKIILAIIIGGTLGYFIAMIILIAIN